MRNKFRFKIPCVFQRSKYLESNKNYFEGWYFKNTSIKNDYLLDVNTICDDGFRLSTPVKGEISRNII